MTWITTNQILGFFSFLMGICNVMLSKFGMSKMKFKGMFLGVRYSGKIHLVVLTPLALKNKIYLICLK